MLPLAQCELAKDNRPFPKTTRMSDLPRQRRGTGGMGRTDRLSSLRAGSPAPGSRSRRAGSHRSHSQRRVSPTLARRVSQPDPPVAADETIPIGGVSDAGTDLPPAQFMTTAWWLVEVALADASGSVVGSQQLAGIEQYLDDGLVQFQRRGGRASGRQAPESCREPPAARERTRP